jgi:DNA-binding GntR family transcriptional regulator
MDTAFAAIDMPRTLADTAYSSLKRDILDFRLAPGDRFTETEIAERLQVSRTPVREALFRLEREGYLEVRQRNGWLVKPLDFNTLDHFYELRSVLEAAAVHALCAPGLAPDPMRALQPLAEIWLAKESDRSNDWPTWTNAFTSNWWPPRATPRSHACTAPPRNGSASCAGWTSRSLTASAGPMKSTEPS